MPKPPRSSAERVPILPSPIPPTSSRMLLAVASSPPTLTSKRRSSSSSPAGSNTLATTTSNSVTPYSPTHPTVTSHLLCCSTNLASRQEQDGERKSMPDTSNVLDEARTLVEKRLKELDTERAR